MTLRRSGGVLQENAQHLAGLVFIDQLVGGNVAFFLQDARDLGLKPRRRNIDALVLGGGGVADARQKIGNRIGLHSLLVAPTNWLSRRREFRP